MNKKSLTKEEDKIMDLIGDIWNGFNKLPIQHPDDLFEFKFGIHYLQGLLMQRVVRRDYPKEYFKINK